MIKQKVIVLILSIVLLGGCATPGIRGTEVGNTLKIMPAENTGFLSWLFPATLPAGEYEYQVSEHKKLKVNTKKDMKLIDINMSKIEGK